MTPRLPLLSDDLTTACLSPCQTHNRTKAPKLVSSIELFNGTDPSVHLFPYISESCVSFFPLVPPSPLLLFVVFLHLCLTLMYSPSCASVISLPADEGTGLPAVKRRRVTAEMEGKYIINMPKGTTPRTRRILAQQSKKGRTDPVAPPTTCASNAATNNSTRNKNNRSERFDEPSLILKLADNWDVFYSVAHSNLITNLFMTSTNKLKSILFFPPSKLFCCHLFFLRCELCTRTGML